MEIRFIKQNDKDFKQCMSIFKGSFSKIQTLPDFIIRILLLNPNSHLIGFYEKDKQLGAAFLSENSKMIYLMYLAVAEEYRGCGYGSKFFTWIKEYAKGRAVAGNVEKNNPNASFFKRILCTDTGYVRTILGHEYNVFSFNEFNITEYKILAKSIYFGLNIVTIEKKI